MSARVRPILVGLATVGLTSTLLVGVGPAAEAATSTTAVATESVSVRHGPGTSHHALGQLVRGQRVTAVGKASGGWIPVRFDGSRAYIAAQYVNVSGHSLPSAPERLNPAGFKIATATVNLRTGPGSSYAKAGSLAEGETTAMTGAQQNGFAAVWMGGSVRWASETYLAGFVGSMTSHSTARSTQVSARVHSAPTSSSSVVTKLGSGSTVRTTGPSSGSYAQIALRGAPRWIRTRYLDTDPTAPSPPIVTPAPAGRGATALAFAVQQIGKPYKYGAAGPNSYDCSGLTQAAWRAAGVTLPRTSQQQFTASPRISREDLQLGDLVFFYGSSPSHVGLYAGNGRIVAAPRPGRSVGYTAISSMPYAGATRPG